MAFPHECADQIFNRLYANSIGRKIVVSNPKIRRTFARWRGGEELLSNLEKNEDLKGILLAETPWVFSADDEAGSKRDLALFFDRKRMEKEISQAPVETQTMMIEYFSELAPGTNEVERLQRWLLKQKQTQHWKTNRATADAIYALLPGGTEPLTDKLTVMDKVPVTVELGGVLALPEETEDGAFYREKRFAASEIRAGMGNVKISRAVDGTAWGGVFWEYFEDIAVITPHETPLIIDKKLFVRKMSESGPVIEPLEKQSVKPGDSLIVRIVLRTERDMQYVYMKDMRPSGTEPVNVLSGYRYQGGLSYYESIRDSAAHFYFYALPQGSHVFEYELRIFHRGDYESGIAEVSCLYAPEFSAHSQSIRLPLNEPDI
jgi:hypothetical protein